MLAFDVPMESDLPDDKHRRADHVRQLVVDGCLPAVDDHLLAEGTPYEIYDGVLVPVPPADDPHGTSHTRVGVMAGTHVVPEFKAVVDTLIRTGEASDIAPDVSVVPRARDPVTGGAQIPQLAFEVCDSESLSHAAGKAKRLVERGVRRVFAIDVKRERVLEWSRELGDWEQLEPDTSIEDRAFGAPLSVESLLSGATVDDAVQRALITKGNRVLEAALEQRRAEGQVEGRAQGKAEMLIAILTSRGLALDEAARARILGERDFERFDDWVARALSCTTISELLAEP
jgi:Uma2 family endonuclease